jgi:glycosyltransferase involved in cell wall biosynthesis
MKIIIASTIVPFIEGGGSFIVDWLEQKLREYGHQIEVVKIPFSSYYKEILPQMTALRLYHLEDECDHLICIRTPSYLIPHPDKYLWFIHHHREVYDLWNTEFDSLPKDPETLAIREFIIRADNIAFSEAKMIYTISRNISNKLRKINNVDSTPLYYPVFNPEQFRCDCYGDYIYYASHICEQKRQFMAAEAMKYTKTGVKLLLTGISENQYARKIRQYIHDNSLEKKITFRDEWITEKQKINYFAECLAAVFIPFDEDGYGYVSLEAHHSRKAVITCTDSGGTGELIIDGKNGVIVEPDPQMLAESFDRLYMDKQATEKMGTCGFNRINELGINWDNVVRAFTQ